MMIVDIVTGATQGIGKAVAEYIAMQRSESLSNVATQKNQNHYALVLVGRNEDRGTQVRDFLRSSTQQLQVHFASCDLSEWMQVQELPSRVASLVLGDTDNTDELFQVGILVNNAAECPPQQRFVDRMRRQRDGNNIAMEKVDKQFASNVLGYHFMIRAFQDYYYAVHQEGNATTTHIVNVASTWAGCLDLTDISFQRRGYSMTMMMPIDNPSNAIECSADSGANDYWSKEFGSTRVIQEIHVRP
ncbi:expressed unknown protein [Seminavis robusta]|uniref:Uncharacterized protein n=1 Tax=Seminavis robusta TaxID=568900 RepID=A0A9N8H1M7_9STRA|nr:expressed unknown protein [Seminavis robusta]|eukprot:Sro5_g004560.1 n/a (245) ;mRNA; r:187319-188053